MTSRASFLGSLLFFFDFQRQKVIQKGTHKRDCSQLNQCRRFTADGGLNHISTQLKLEG